MTGAHIPHRRRLVAVAAVVAAAALALSGCSGTSSTPQAGGGTLHLANALNTPSTYNPWGAGYGINYSLWWSGSLYDSLVRLDGSGKVQPGLAKSWEQDGGTTTLHLRNGVKFSDGSTLDASAVKANIDYAVANPAGNECNAYLAGAETKAVDANTVTITLPTPLPGLLTDLGQCAGFIANPKALADPDSFKSAPAGSGPYTLDKANTIAGQKYTFVRNKNYWDKAAFKFDSIVITQFSSTTAATNAVQSGQQDLIANLLSSDVKGVSGSNVKLSSGQPNFYQGVWIMDSAGKIAKPLADVRVRQAMNYALDRDSLVKSFVGDDGFAIGATPFAEYYEGYSDSLKTVYPYDVAKAKQLLAEAGYPKGFTVSIVSQPGQSQITQAMAGMLAKVGITLKITLAGSNFISAMQSGKYSMVQAAYTLNAAQYQTIKGIVGENGFWNPQHYKDAKVDALLTKISQTPEGQTESLYTELATTIANESLQLGWTISSQIVLSNPHKVTSTSTPGVGVPMIYNIKPAA